MSSPRVLVVEDDPETVRLIVSLLRDQPCRLLCPGNPRDALRLARTQGPDRILVSWAIRHMTGDQFADLLSLQPSTRDLPVALLALEPWLIAERHRDRAVQIVDQTYIRDELVARVRDALNLPPSPGTSAQELARIRDRGQWWTYADEPDWRARLRSQLALFPSPRRSVSLELAS
ncbi:MAG: hypothetical protein M3281_10315 [Chloroflexota bacterium]|nr:hypothetical protein [Chloroflexota bacterium]